MTCFFLCASFVFWRMPWRTQSAHFKSACALKGGICSVLRFPLIWDSASCTVLTSPPTWCGCGHKVRYSPEFQSVAIDCFVTTLINLLTSVLVSGNLPLAEQLACMTCYPGVLRLATSRSLEIGTNIFQTEILLLSSKHYTSYGGYWFFLLPPVLPGSLL